jgi:hypothetical protein
MTNFLLRFFGSVVGWVFALGEAGVIAGSDLIYTTQDGTEIWSAKGSKKESAHDFIVKYRAKGKRERTPKHIHLIVEMYVKYAFDPDLTMKLRNHTLAVFEKIKPIDYYPPQLQVFRPGDDTPFKKLDKVGEFSTEFLIVASELIMIQEKTNYPKGSLTQSLYKSFGEKDRFSVIQAAAFRNR